MINNKQIPTLLELVDLYDKKELDIKSLPKIIPCYFTQEHKEKDFICWTTPQEIIGMSVFKKKLEEIEKDYN